MKASLRGILVLLLASSPVVWSGGPAAASSPSGAAGAKQLYVRKDTWQETLHATRERYLKWRELQGGRDPVELGPWYATGPHRVKSFAEALFPEKEVDLKARDGKGKPVWRRHPEWEDGRVYYLPRKDRASTYLFRTIRASAPAKMKVRLGSDDGMVLWLNGRTVISRDVPRGVAADQDRAVLDLKAGENVLLFKIHNQTGQHGFYFATAQGGDSTAASLWRRAESDFPVETGWMRGDIGRGGQTAWLRDAGGVEREKEMIGRALKEIGPVMAGEGGGLRREFEALRRARVSPNDRRWLDLYVEACRRRHGLRAARKQLKLVNLEALRLAIRDLAKSFPETYAKGEEYLRRVAAYGERLSEADEALARGDVSALKRIEKFLAFRREALLANPFLDFDRLLLIKRSVNRLGLPQNWQGNCAIARTGYDNEIALLSPVGPQGKPAAAGKLSTVFRPEGGKFVGDVDLHFDADRMLFSMPGSHGRWQIWEVKADGTGLRQVTPGEHPDVDNYDPCYLPGGRIIFGSTRCFHGVPCVGGGNTVANFCVMDSDGKNIRQLCFDQDHNWCPTVLNSGRVLYTRWEYSDGAHYFDRLLFHMNPDGTAQMEYYGSNSYWPNSIFYARPIPGHATEVVGIVSGHHGVARMGELVIFDPARGRHEGDGAVQRIPGYGKPVGAIIRDQLVNSSWPRFLHPYPLSGKHFLVSCKPTRDSLWGIYLVDIFDNMLLLAEVPGYALFEPVPIRKRPRPPVVPDKVRPGNRDAVVYLSDVYVGRGLAGVPRGTVKKLRVYEFHYAYPRMGGHINIGIDGPWDVHRIRGTVPVHEDGSASFKVPANTPLAVQPLDAEGKAVQVMRSWFTAMPGEVLSCVGCHERQNMSPPVKATVASRRAPSEITPWYGPTRGFSFKREVQPVLDRHCVGCHNGKPLATDPALRPALTDGKTIPDFSDTGRGWRGFTKSYIALHPYVRRPGPESDYHLQKPCEWHADTSELVQMLKKGHKKVKLDAEAWDRLVTWIDLNVPDHGTWGEHRKIHGDYHRRRLEMRTRYGNRPEDPEKYPTPPPGRMPFVKPDRSPAVPAKVLRVNDGRAPVWPYSAAEAKRRVGAVGLPRELKVDLGSGAKMDLVLVPAGEFVMGSADGCVDERPLSRVRIERAFYMGRFEVTNEQFALFDPDHDSGYISVFNKDQSNRGEAANRPRQPVIRVSWKEALAFCRRLSEKTGREFSLPTEREWEYAARAGTATALYYGACDADFGKFANLADQQVNKLTRRDSPKWIPSVDSVNDGAVVTGDVGRYRPNAWGLHDMHGNACEWTLTTYRPSPHRADGRPEGRKVVRGGSFYDRPKRARSAFRLSYPSWRRVYNVGFRVVCGTDTTETRRH